MLTLFIISALVPLALSGAILYSQFSSGLRAAQQRSLDELARSYGMTILGRLEAADEALRLFTSESDAGDALAESRANKLSWVKSASTADIPALSARQAQLLKTGASALIANTETPNRPRLYLVRQLPSGTLFRAEINTRFIWSDAGDFSGEATLLVKDAGGHILVSSGEVPTGATAVRAWDIFLGSRFASQSWTVVAMEDRPAILRGNGESYLPIFAFIVLTVLLIAWLSMIAIRRQLRPLDLLIRATRRFAQRDFSAFRDLTWNDEFGDLARSFGTMSGKLQKQFAALETFSDVDRLLLDEKQLESILDAMLPQIAAILGCERASVLLFDSHSSDSASLHEYCASRSECLPMKRVSRATGKFFTEEFRRVETHDLRQGEDSTGMLCLAYADTDRNDQDSAVEASDFADRLSLIIASLRRSDQLRRQASFDALTGLQNRQTLARYVSEAVTTALYRDCAGSLLYIDLDHFKRVNDTSGHAVGDRLLQIVGERLCNSVGTEASIARLGGDEFAVLLPSIANTESAWETARTIIAKLEQPIEIDSRLHHISASIGITLFPNDGSTLEELMRVGDIAMYQAKDRGRGKAELYRPDMQWALLQRVRLEEGLKRAFEQRELVVHYQPIVSRDDEPPGTFAVEALLRWPVEGGTAWIPPSDFIPLAEENGLIVELGLWVLQSTCEQFVRWRKSGIRVSYASVNVSVRQLKEADYLEILLHTLRQNGMRGEELQIEITESVLAHNAELKGILGKIAAHGVRLALDDFGTGYSSLGYLRTFPIDTVKIDRSFIIGVPHDRDASRLVESIILMCDALGKAVVAEGIETEEQRQYLIGAGCTTLQGYFFGRPMAAADIPGFANRLSGARDPVIPNTDLRVSGGCG